ncbi:MAG: ABC transporter permease [Mycobacterium sp.]
MTSALLDRPGTPDAPTAAWSAKYTGTLRLLRLYLRRDRIVAPLWILLLSVPLATVYVGSISKVYPTDADRAGMVASIMASPAQRAMYGNIYADNLGALGVWKAGMFHVLIAVAVILTVIRHTRADEEAGRVELLDSTAIGRYAGLTAALGLSFGASLLTGLIGFAGLLTVDIPAAGSLAFALALAGSGLVFSAVAAVAAQLSANARTARGLAFAVLAAAFTLRAVGDAQSATGWSPLSWLSPLGWSLQVRPFAGERWWVLALHLIACVVLTVLAFRLLRRRDVGAGLLAERAGPGSAAPGLAGPLGLARRVSRGALLLWTVGLCLYGLMIGSVAHGVGDEIGDSGPARDIVVRLGGTAAMEQAFIAIAFSMLGMVASAFVISMLLRLHQEEATGRAETLLAGAVGRTRWLASYLTLAIVGSAVAMLLAGAVTGLTYGIAAGDVGAKLPTVIATAAVQLPAVWLLAAVTVALFGLTPRFTPAAWAVLVAFIALYMLGSLAGFPQWLLNLEPFSHIPRVDAGSFTAVPLLWLLAADIVLILLGASALRRRDLR